jgi:hypothetical protein
MKKFHQIKYESTGNPQTPKHPTHHHFAISEIAQISTHLMSFSNAKLFPNGS